MTIDWDRLQQVRQSHLDRRRREVAAQRAVAEASTERAQLAEHYLQQQTTERAQVWTEVQNSGPVLSIEAVRQATAWSRVLDRRVAQAADQVSHAWQLDAVEQSRLLETRLKLRQAHGELEKSKQMIDRHQLEQRQLAERRQESQTDDGALSLWPARGRRGSQS